MPMNSVVGAVLSQGYTTGVGGSSMSLGRREPQALQAFGLSGSMHILGTCGLLMLMLSGCGTTKLTSNSTVATQAIVLVPTLTSQPVDAAVKLGQAASFSVSATGTGTLTYQW